MSPIVILKIKPLPKTENGHLVREFIFRDTDEPVTIWHGTDLISIKPKRKRLSP